GDVEDVRAEGVEEVRGVPCLCLGGFRRAGEGFGKLGPGAGLLVPGREPDSFLHTLNLGCAEEMCEEGAVRSLLLCVVRYRSFSVSSSTAACGGWVMPRSITLTSSSWPIG